MTKEVKNSIVCIAVLLIIDIAGLIWISGNPDFSSSGGMVILVAIPWSLYLHVLICLIAFFITKIRFVIPFLLANSMLSMIIIIMGAGISGEREFRNRYDIWTFEKDSTALKISIDQSYDSTRYNITAEYGHGKMFFRNGSVKYSGDTIFFYKEPDVSHSLRGDTIPIISESEVFFITGGFVYDYDTTRRLPVRKTH